MQKEHPDTELRSHQVHEFIVKRRRVECRWCRTIIDVDRKKVGERCPAREQRESLVNGDRSLQILRDIGKKMKAELRSEVQKKRRPPESTKKKATSSTLKR